MAEKVDVSLQDFFAETTKLNSERHGFDRQDLQHGGGGGTSGGMEERVTKLETHFEYVRRDLDDIKSAQRTSADTQTRILDKLNLLPTRTELNTWRWQWVAIAVAIIALTVGGITGGLALIAANN